MNRNLLAYGLSVYLSAFAVGYGVNTNYAEGTLEDENAVLMIGATLIPVINLVVGGTILGAIWAKEMRE